MTKIGTTLRTSFDGAQIVKYRNASTGIAASDVQRAIDVLFGQIVANASQPPNLTRKTITAAMSPYAMLANDFYLEVDVSGGPVTINAVAAAARGNLPVIIKHAAGNAVANNVTINPAGGETFDGQPSLVIDFNYGGFRLQPITGGWELIP